MLTRVGKLLAVLSALALLVPVHAAVADSNLVQAGFSAPGSITCGGSATATVTITGQSPPPSLQPSSIMLVLDGSGSMGLSNNLVNLKSAGNRFIDLMDNGDGNDDDTITGSDVGLVSFSYIAKVQSAPTTDAALLKNTVNGLTASGPTNIADAINMAQTQLNGNPHKRVMLVLTDGFNTYPTTSSSAAVTAAANAKAAGTEIYTLGFGKVNMSVLQQIASAPDHIFVAPTSDQLNQLFETAFAAVLGASGKQLKYSAQPSSDFIITAASASKGTVSFSANSLSWALDKLASETATITYTLRHTGGANGARSIHQAADLTWIDSKGPSNMSASFGDAKMQVSGCGPVVLIKSPGDGTYTDDTVLTMDFGATFAFSAEASLVANIDSMPVTDGQKVDLYPLGLTGHTLTVQAKDKAGNVDSQSVSFNVITSYDAMFNLLHRFQGEGLIDKKLAKRLEHKLKEAEKAFQEEGRKKDADRKEDQRLKEFIKQINKAMKKKDENKRKIKDPAASVLVRDAQWMIDR